MASPSVQRKLTAILSADVVGYSRLMGKDEEGTLAALKRHRKELIDPKIGEHRGRIVKTTGDGLLIEFPSVVEAVRNAVDVQRGMAKRNTGVPHDRRIEFRVGVNLGDVIIDGDDIHGDGVNVAARLQELAEPGGVCISATVHEHIRSKLDLAFDDLGEKRMKNIATPIRVYKVSTNELSPTAVARAVDVSKPVPGFGSRPAIAVLPFVNMSGDEEQEYFADGLTEDIITGLSNWRWFPVIARNSTFTYKGKAVEVRQVGQELGARYVLEGSVRKAGNRVRISGQLIEADSGHHVWAQRYDRDLDDIFAVQDEITQSIVATIEPELEQAEQQRASLQPPENLDAWDLVQRGKWHQNRLTREDAAKARPLFERALQVDQNSAEALIQLAWWHFWNFWTRRGAKAWLDEAEAPGRFALALDDKDARAHNLLANVHLYRRQHEQARVAIARAIELNPSLALAHLWLCHINNFDGRPDAAIEPIQTALRLSPNDPSLWLMKGALALAHYLREAHEDALACADQALERRPGYWLGHVVRIGSLARLGRLDDASTALAELLGRKSGLAEQDVEWLPFRERKWHQYLVDGLAKAGWEG